MPTICATFDNAVNCTFLGTFLPTNCTAKRATIFTAFSLPNNAAKPTAKPTALLSTFRPTYCLPLNHTFCCSLFPTDSFTYNKAYPTAFFAAIIKAIFATICITIH